jgi:hypothetical protein
MRAPVRRIVELGERQRFARFGNPVGNLFRPSHGV